MVSVGHNSLTVTGLGGGGGAGGGTGCGIICAALGTYSATSRQSLLRLVAAGRWDMDKRGNGGSSEKLGTGYNTQPYHASPVAAGRS